jgi:hypothetical protein
MARNSNGRPSRRLRLFQVGQVPHSFCTTGFKSKKDGEADAAEKELARFRKNEIIVRLDRLQAGTVWAGASLGASAGKVRRNDEIKLMIVERDGERFKAKLTWNASMSPRVINGHIKGRQIWWTKDDLVDQGRWGGTEVSPLVGQLRLHQRQATPHEGRGGEWAGNNFPGGDGVSPRRGQVSENTTAEAGSAATITVNAPATGAVMPRRSSWDRLKGLKQKRPDLIAFLQGVAEKQDNRLSSMAARPGLQGILQ